MAPITVAQSPSGDSTEASLHLKSNLVIEPIKPPSLRDNRNEDEILASASHDDREEDSPLSQEGSFLGTRSKLHQTSDLFADEHKDNSPSSLNRFNFSISPGYFGGNGGPSPRMPSPSELFSKLSSSSAKRFGLFSPSGSGEMEDVDLKKSGASAPAMAIGDDTPLFGLAQISADEELARQLQAEEDRRTKHPKARPKPAPSIFGLEPTPWEIRSQFTSTVGGVQRRGSTLECWVSDSLASFGRRVSESASEFFGEKSGGSSGAER